MHQSAAPQTTHRHSAPRPKLRGVLLALALGLATSVLVTACGGGDSSNEGSAGKARETRCAP